MGFDKNILYVPKGIRYIGDWEDYSLSNYDFPHILDKKIPGCGYTYYCLTCDEDVVLTSPRRILLENKENQHKGDVFYYRLDPQYEVTIDADLNIITKPADPKKRYTEEELEEWVARLQDDLRDYIVNRKREGKPMKIIVTYDSFGNLKDFLNTCFGLGGFEGTTINQFHVVVDEFQSIFVDSKFKSETEIKLLKDLKGLKKVCYVSATPMIDEYLSEIDEFKDLPYYEINWAKYDPSRVIKPDLKVHDIKPKSSVIQEAKKIIEKYREGKFEILSNINGQTIESREAVFYVNSVNNIISIINKCGLRLEETNILCSNTPDNVSRIKRKIKKDICGTHKIGSVPLKGEPHKMFTFCTRTVYLGADFYSLCARTFILSDANIDSLAVDISLDLPQILGRQRLIENPWKNRADFYFKPLGSSKHITQDEFKERLDKKIKKTESLLLSYKTSPTFDTKEDLADTYEKVAKSYHYRDDYVAVNSEYDSINNIKIKSQPIFNKLVYISERRAFEIQQIDYKDRFTVFNVLDKSEDIDISKVTMFVNHLRDTSKTVPDRLRELCETLEFTEEEKKVIAHDVSAAFEAYYCILGPERCRALGYRTERLNKELSDRVILDTSSVKDMLLVEFKVGIRYKKSDIKETLKTIYNKLGLTKTAKANDLEEYFEIKSILVTDPATKKRENAFEILGIKNG